MKNLKITAAKSAITKKPNSKATALMWYLKDYIGLLHNPATPELRAEFALEKAKVKGRNAPAIVEICRDCVGEGADGNCRDSVRNCEIKDCFLYIVRPYQNKSKVSLKYVTPRAISRSNASEVIERPVPTNKPSIKPLLEHITTDFFSVEM